MTRRRIHWPPHHNERVHSFSRDASGEQPDGVIVFIERDYRDQSNTQILVKYEGFKTIREHGHYILTINGDVHWNASDVPALIAKYGWPIPYEYIWTGEVIEEGSGVEIKDYWLDDFEGCWSSSDGGNERWEIE